MIDFKYSITRFTTLIQNPNWVELWESFNDTNPNDINGNNDNPSLPLMILTANRKGECGLNDTRNLILFHIFQLGCAGDDDTVLMISKIPTPTTLNNIFFKKLACLIKYIPCCFDWDWSSIQNNLVEASIAYILSNMNLSQIITDWLLTGLYIILND